jgi:dTDP-4-amino-4,6-dideoxygalactose transaminase
MQLLPYARQSISSQDIQAVEKALNSPYITRGPYVAAFEAAVAQYCNTVYAVAFNSGTTALQAACHAAQVGPNDRILTTPNSFAATLIAGMQKQARPIFVDIDRSTGNLDLNKLHTCMQEIRFTRGRFIIMPVHFAGIAVDMEALNRLICRPNTLVIEDAAAAFGSEYPKNSNDEGYKLGSCAWSQMTIFSFHPAKTITTGEGGMVLTNDADLNHRLRRFRDNGIERTSEWHTRPMEETYPGYYEVAEMTGNFHMTAFQAALGISQLARIDAFITKRRQLVAIYRKLLAYLPGVRLLDETADEITAFNLFVVQIDFPVYKTTRTHVMQALKERGIGTQVHYIPLYRHPFYRNRYRDCIEAYPEMEQYYAQTLSLPLYYDLQEVEVENIVETLKAILHSAKTAVPAHKHSRRPHSNSHPRHARHKR